MVTLLLSVSLQSWMVVELAMIAIAVLVWHGEKE
jgi:hypothetical protein